jgi:hypothetical protein
MPPRWIAHRSERFEPAGDAGPTVFSGLVRRLLTP